MDNTIAEIVFKQLKTIEENTKCFDCGKIFIAILIPISFMSVGQDHPQWASVNNGIFICMNCAGVHRSLGTDNSFVRSLNIDAWNDKQLKFMSVGGNKQLKEHLEQYGLADDTIQSKYERVAV